MHFRLPSMTAISSHIQQTDSTCETPPTFPQNRRLREFKKDPSDSRAQTAEKLWTSAYKDSCSEMWYKNPQLVEKIEKNSARFPAELPDWLAETKIKCSKHDFRKRFERARPSELFVSADFDLPGGLFDQGKGTRRDLALLKSVFALAICLYDRSSDAVDETQNIGKVFLGLNILRLYGDERIGGISTEEFYIILRDMYESLFEFFFQAHDLIQERHFWTKSPPQDAQIWTIAENIREYSDALILCGQSEAHKVLIKTTHNYLGTRPKFDEHHFKKDTTLKGAEKSFEWIHSDPEFRQWLQDDTRFLATSGPDGCGKTCTTRYLVNELQQKEEKNEDKPAMVCTYYCGNGSYIDMDGTKTILRSLITQLVEKKPDLDTHLTIDNFAKIHRYPSLSQLISLLQRLVASARCPIFILIDALGSRNSERPQEVIEALLKIDARDPFKIFVSYQGGVSLDIPDDQFISMTHDCSPERDRIIAEYWVEKALSKKSNSTDDCHRPKFSRGELVEILCDFPGALALYPRAVKCANEVLKCAAEFLAVAKRPLRLIELRWALSMISFHDFHCRFLDKTFGIEWVLERIGPALRDHVHEEPSGTLDLIDKVSILTRKDVPFWGDMDDTADAHGLLASACIEYLGRADFSKSVFDVEAPETDGAVAAALAAAHPFFDYAALAWTHHAASAGHSWYGNARHEIDRFCDGTRNVENWILYGHTRVYYTPADALTAATNCSAKCWELYEDYQLVVSRLLAQHGPLDSADFWVLRGRIMDAADASQGDHRRRKLGSQFFASIDTFELPPGDPDFVDIVD